jgi:hypothetical protein
MNVIHCLHNQKKLCNAYGWQIVDSFQVNTEYWGLLDLDDAFGKVENSCFLVWEIDHFVD